MERSMARRPKRQYRRKGGKRGKYIKGNVDELLTLTGLVANTLVGTQFDDSVNERTFISSLVASYSISNFTLGTDDGPIMVGVAHSDYSDAEIEAVIEVTGSWNEGDLIAREVGQRLVRVIGIFRATGAATETMTLQEGKMIRTKLGWILLQSQSLRLWAYNLGTSNLATTAPTIRVQGHVNLWPR